MFKIDIVALLVFSATTDFSYQNVIGVYAVSLYLIYVSFRLNVERHQADVLCLFKCEMRACAVVHVFLSNSIYRQIYNNLKLQAN